MEIDNLLKITEPINSCPVPNGILLVVGGHEDKGQEEQSEVQKKNGKHLEILKAFIDLIDKEDCIIEVITTASSEGAESFDDYRKVFSELGITNIGHIHHDKRGEILNEDISDRIKRADGVYFSGGDQLKLTSIYGGSDILFQLKQRYISDGLVVGGTSAGAMALSTPMIYAGSKEVEQIAGQIKITTGLEFLKDVCIDTHFVDRGRFIRMAQVVASNPTSVGIGIEEDTAIIVREGIQAEVIGSGVVIIIEGFGITDSNVTNFNAENRIYISDLKVKVLAKGNKYIIPQINPPHI
jgi:cyanophycinase